MLVRWMIYGLVMLAASLPASAEELLLPFKSGKPGAEEFRLAAVRAFYKRNYEIRSIDPDRVTARYGGGAVMEIALKDDAIAIRRAESGKMNTNWANNLRRELLYELAAYLISAPTLEQLTSAASAPAAAGPSGTPVSGRYVSRITSNSQYIFDKKDARSITLELVQDGDKVTGTNQEYDLKLIGTREGNRISFYCLPSKITFTEIKGEWTVSADGNSLEGKWTAGGAVGNWNLSR